MVPLPASPEGRSLAPAPPRSRPRRRHQPQRPAAPPLLSEELRNRLAAIACFGVIIVIGSLALGGLAYEFGQSDAERTVNSLIGKLKKYHATLSSIETEDDYTRKRSDLNFQRDKILKQAEKPLRGTKTDHQRVSGVLAPRLWQVSSEIDEQNRRLTALLGSRFVAFSFHAQIVSPNNGHNVQAFPSGSAQPAPLGPRY